MIVQNGLYAPNAYNPCYLIDQSILTHFSKAYLKFKSGELLRPGDYGYVQVKRGDNPNWINILTLVHGTIKNYLKDILTWIHT